MTRIVYAIYGLFVVLGVSYAGYRGARWFAPSPREVRNIPQTVRQNPGSYRTIYGSTYHYRGGK